MRLKGTETWHDVGHLYELDIPATWTTCVCCRSRRGKKSWSWRSSAARSELGGHGSIIAIRSRLIGSSQDDNCPAGRNSDSEVKTMIRRRSRNRRGIPSGAIGQLRFGRDFFGDGWGPWTETTLEAARDAWGDPRIREQVYHQHGQRKGVGLPWAAVAFGRDAEGGSVVTLGDVQASLEERSELSGSSNGSIEPTR